MKGTFPFSILKGDFEASSKDYEDTSNCPGAVAFRRQFPDYNIRSMIIGFVTLPYGKRGYLKDRFEEFNFNALRDNGTEFHTTITFE